MENQIENKPIKILHMIGGLDIGGSQIFVMNLYRKIDRNKVQFDFVIDHPKERFLEEEIKKLAVDGAKLLKGLAEQTDGHYCACHFCGQLK